MIRFCLFFAVFGAVFSASAHPSWGMVVRADGSLIVADIFHAFGTIWQISPAGEVTRLLKGEHSHSLMLDAHGRVWGTDHEYIEAIDGNENSLWYLNKAGQKQLVIAPTRDPKVFSGVSFAVDEQGQVYYDWQNQLYRHSPDGNHGLFSEHTFGRVMNISLGPDGMIYVADQKHQNGSIFRVDAKGKAHLWVSKLIEAEPGDPPFPNPMHNIFHGLSLLPDGRGFVAVTGSRSILEISHDGEVSTFFQSQAPWYPLAVAFDGAQAILMEAAFIEGKGHQGPRISRLIEGEAKPWINLDQPDTIIRTQLKEAATPAKSEAAPSPNMNAIYWVLFAAAMLMLAGAIQFMVIPALRKKRHSDS